MLTETDTLESWGFDAFFQSQLSHAAAGGTPARVTEVLGIACRVVDANGERVVELAPMLRNKALSRVVVGDWVLVATQAQGADLIVTILERKTKLSRRAAGKEAAEQTLVANVDAAWLVTSLNSEFNERRLERYLTLVQGSGVVPCVVLTKRDLATESQTNECLASVQRIAPNIAVNVVSAVTQQGIDELLKSSVPCTSIALLGSSGVGKSTLLNVLLGRDVQTVAEVRTRDERGLHTTTTRRMFRLENGALLIDTPGMRELGLWEPEQALSESFADIRELETQCRFRDCRHALEPGCAVKAALDSGHLLQERYASYKKLEQEIESPAPRSGPSSKRTRWR